MKRNVRHIHARKDQWIRVHRSDSAPRGGGGAGNGLGTAMVWLVQALFIIAVIATVSAVSALMPYLVSGLMGWGVLQAFLRRK